jgi:GDPmannose 4,6-dehydratase
MMLHQEKPEDFVIGSGETHSVREFCDLAFAHVGLDYNDFVVQDQRFYRPAEVDLLVSDPSKAARTLGWRLDVGFKGLVEMMVNADMERLKTPSASPEFPQR